MRKLNRAAPKAYRRPKALASYIFAGGFTVGVEQHFDVQAHLEGAHGYGAEVVRLNRPQLPIFLEPWPLEELVEQHMGIDFVYGNPPCAAWSGNNPNSHKEGAWRSDPRLECTLKHFDLIEKLRPKVWACESVTQAPEKGREFYDGLIERAAAMGYSTIEFFHDVKWHGTPQTRKRWMLIFHRVALTLPAPNWSPPETAVEALAKVKPVGEPAYDSVGNKKFLKWLPKMKPGTRLRKLWEQKNPEEKRVVKSNGHVLGRPGFGHVRLRVDEPASATVGYSMIHPTEHRFLSVNEVGVLAGFPDGYQFPGGERGAKQLDYIARGVCPPMGEWLARAVAVACAADQPLPGKPKVTVYDYREPPASSTDVQVRDYAVGEPRTAPAEPQRRLPRTDPDQGDPAPPRPSAAPSPADRNLGSGAYAKQLLALEAYTTEEVVAAVRAHWPESRCGAPDVSFYRAQLRDAGRPVRVVRETVKGRRLLPLKG